MISFILRPVRLIALLALAGAGVGAYVIWSGAHHSTAADQGGALAEYRALHISDTTPARGVPAPGVYRYRVRGSEKAGSGLVSAERALPAEAVYIITPIAGGYHEDLRLSEEHVEEAKYRVSGGDVLATWRRTKVTFLGIGADDKTDVVPASVDHPVSGFTAGRSWGGRYALGATGVTYRGRVVGKGTATLDGRSVPVVTLRTDSTFTGPTPGRRTDVIAWSPALNLPVAWTITQKTGGDADFSITAGLQLESGTPVR